MTRHTIFLPGCPSGRTCAFALLLFPWIAACGAQTTQTTEPRHTDTGFTVHRGQEPISLSELIPPLLDDEAYYDNFSFNFELEGDLEVYFNFFITNIGPGQGKLRARCRVSQKKPEEVHHKYVKEMNRGDWTSSATVFDLDAGIQRLSGTPEKLMFEAKGADFSLKLEAIPDVSPWHPPEGSLTLQADPTRYYHMLLFPHFNVKGSVSFGDETRSVTGYGHGDHSFSNVAPYEFSSRWVTFTSVTEGWTVFVKQCITAAADGRKEYAWVIASGPKGQRFVSKDVELRFDDIEVDDHENEYEIPHKTIVRARAGEDELWLLIKAETLRSRSDPLQSMNAMVRMFAKALTKPLDVSHYADFAANARISGTTYAFDGSGVSEIKFLNK